MITLLFDLILLAAIIAGPTICIGILLYKCGMRKGEKKLRKEFEEYQKLNKI